MGHVSKSWNDGRRRTARGFFVAIACLLMCQAASPQTLSARIEWFGIYTLGTIRDANDPAGRRPVSAPVQGQSTDRIPGKEGVRFGFSYILSGDKKGTKVTVKHVYKFPGGGLPAPGGPRTMIEQAREDLIGEPVLVGWSFVGAPPENIVAGEWSLEVWRGDQKLVEKKFTVLPP